MNGVPGSLDRLLSANDDTQLDLFLPMTEPTAPRSLPIGARFVAFHNANPHVYHLLRREAHRLVDRGVRRIGIAMLFERLRWLYHLNTTGDRFKLNNNYRSHYARMLMANDPDLAGVFDTRELRAA